MTKVMGKKIVIQFTYAVGYVKAITINQCNRIVKCFHAQKRAFMHHP